MKTSTRRSLACSGQDRGITPDDVHKVEVAMKQLGNRIDVEIYDHAGRGFENENNERRLPR